LPIANHSDSPKSFSNRSVRLISFLKRSIANNFRAGCLSCSLRAFFLLSKSQPLYVVRIMCAVHNICPTVVKRVASVQVAGEMPEKSRRIPLRAILARKNLMSVGYDRASNQRIVSMGCPPGAGTRIKGQNRPKAIRVLNENNHEKRNQNKERSKRDESTVIPNCFVIPYFW
jgi:hypothetical protein